MHLYILWGNSLSNKERVQELSVALRSQFSEVNVWTYEYWVDTSRTIDTCHEGERLFESLPDSGKIGIVAKSAWCLVALEAMKNFKLNPDLVLFAGFPVHFAIETLGWDLGKILREISYDKPIHLVQQTEDPAATPEEVTKYFSDAWLQTIWHFYEWKSHYYEVATLQKYIISSLW